MFIFSSLAIRKSKIIWQSYVTHCNFQLEAPKAMKVYWAISSMKAGKASDSKSCPEFKFFITIKVNPFFSLLL